MKEFLANTEITAQLQQIKTPNSGGFFITDIMRALNKKLAGNKNVYVVTGHETDQHTEIADNLTAAMETKNERFFVFSYAIGPDHNIGVVVDKELQQIRVYDHQDSSRESLSLNDKALKRISSELNYPVVDGYGISPYLSQKSNWECGVFCFLSICNDIASYQKEAPVAAPKYMPDLETAAAEILLKAQENALFIFNNLWKEQFPETTPASWITEKFKAILIETAENPAKRQDLKRYIAATAQLGTLTAKNRTAIIGMIENSGDGKMEDLQEYFKENLEYLRKYLPPETQQIELLNNFAFAHFFEKENTISQQILDTEQKQRDEFLARKEELAKTRLDNFTKEFPWLFAGMLDKDKAEIINRYNGNLIDLQHEPSPAKLNELLLEVIEAGDVKTASAILTSKNPLVGLSLDYLSEDYLSEDIKSVTCLSLACEQGRTAIVQLILAWKGKDGKCVNPASNNNYAIRSACKQGHFELVKLLLADSRVDPTTILATACSKAQLEIINLLLKDPRVKMADLKRVNTIALAWGEGVFEENIDQRIKSVTLLLQDPRTEPDCDVLEQAYEDHHLELIELFVKHPKIDLNRVFTIACKKNDMAFAKTLLPDPRVDLLYSQDFSLEWVKEHLIDTKQKGQVELLAKKEELRKDKLDKLTTEFPWLFEGVADKNKAQIVKKYSNNLIALQLEQSEANLNNFFLAAVQAKDFTAAGRMLTNKLVDPTIEEDYAIRVACDKGATEFVKQLLDFKGEKDDKRVNPAAGGGYDPCIIQACRNGHAEIVELLLKWRGKNGECIDPAADDNAALRLACNSEVVRILLKDERVDPTAVFLDACKVGSSEMVKQMLEWKGKDGRRIDPTAKDNAAIKFACKKANIEVAKLLFEWKGENSQNLDFTSAFEFICAQNNENLVPLFKLMLQDGRVDPAANNNLAFQKVCKYGNAEFCGLMLQDQRVDPKVGNNNAFYLACMENHPKIVKLMLQDGRVNPEDKDNYALQLASKYGYIEVAQMLLSWGEEKGKSVDNSVLDICIDNAKKVRHDKLVELLQDHQKAIAKPAQRQETEKPENPASAILKAGIKGYAEQITEGKNSPRQK